MATTAAAVIHSEARCWERRRVRWPVVCWATASINSAVRFTRIQMAAATGIPMHGLIAAPRYSSRYLRHRRRPLRESDPRRLGMRYGCQVTGSMMAAATVGTVVTGKCRHPTRAVTSLVIGNSRLTAATSTFPVTGGKPSRGTYRSRGGRIQPPLCARPRPNSFPTVTTFPPRKCISMNFEPQTGFPLSSFSVVMTLRVRTSITSGV